MLNEDYKEMLQILSGNEVRFLVVGAYAMALYGYPRATGDFDLWILASPENSKKVYKSLAEFGAPLDEIGEETFNEEGVVFQIGVAPRRIDILTRIDGVDFERAYRNKREVEIEGLKIPFISRQDLVMNKQSTGRDKDRLDAEWLKDSE